MELNEDETKVMASGNHGQLENQEKWYYGGKSVNVVNRPGRMDVPQTCIGA